MIPAAPSTAPKTECPAPSDGNGPIGPVGSWGPGHCVAQEELTRLELEGEYRVALADYEAAFQRFEILSDQFDAASRDFASATAAGDEGGPEQGLRENLSDRQRKKAGPKTGGERGRHSSGRSGNVS